MHEQTQQAEQTEVIRQREVREGNLFDCQHKYYAAVTFVGNQKMCAGYKMGVGGRGLAPPCSSCDNYAQSLTKCIELQAAGQNRAETIRSVMRSQEFFL